MPDSREETDVDEDDFSDEQDSEEEGATPASPEQGQDPGMDKLRKENRALRSKLRRSEISAKYGPGVVDLIPDELPIRKWDEFAEKLHARLAERPAPTETGEPAEVPEEPTQAERKLAAVSKAGSAPSATAAASTITRDELHEIYKQQGPDKAAQYIKEGRVIWHNPPS